MKRKTLSLTLCLLTCLALIGVGFAAWLITYDSSVEKTGNITVETVNTRTYQIVVEAVTSEIRFTAPSTMSAPNQWLTSDADKGSEQLEAVFTVYVNITDNGAKEKVQVNYPRQSGENNSSLPTITDTFAIIDTVESNGAWATAVSNNVVAQLTVDNVTWAENKTGSEVSGFQYTYTVKVKGAWGSHFDGNNPYTFYNSKPSANTKVSAAEDALTWGQDAKKYLDYVAAIEPVTFKLTVTVAAPTNA